MVCHELMFNLEVETLTFKNVSGLYLRDCKV